MKDGKPVNWVHVAMRLTQFINDTGPRQFDGPLDVITYLDEIDFKYNGHIKVNHD